MNVWGLGLGLSWLLVSVGAVPPSEPYRPDMFTSLLLHFDEGEGTTARDASEFGHFCLLKGARWTEGHFGSGLDCHEGVAVVPYSPALDAEREVTIEAWLWVEGPSSEIQRVAYRSSVYGLYLGANSLNLVFYVKAAKKWESVTAPVPARQWVHVAGTYDGTRMRLFVNGELKAERPKTGLIVQSEVPLEIGGEDQPRRRLLQGRVDEVRVSHIARPRFDPREKMVWRPTVEFRPAPVPETPLAPALPQVRLGRCSAPPRINGRLDDPCWQDAARLRLDNAPPGQRTTQPTEVFLTYDREWLYLAFRCQEAQMAQIVAEQTRRDAEVWRDDCVEIFLRPDPQAATYYHLAINSRGTLYDARCTPRAQAGWNLPAQVAAQRGEQEWTVELACPLTALKRGGVQLGERWRVNFGREERPHGELSAWSPVGRRFHQPDKFGWLEFGTKPSRPAEETFTLRGLLRDRAGRRARGVMVVTPAGTTRTDYFGYFEVKGLPRGRTLIVFSSPRYEPLAGEVNPRQAVEIVLPPPLEVINPYRYAFELPPSPLGYRVYAVNYLDDLDPTVPPAERQHRVPLRTFATPGEYEPLSCVLYALRDLHHVRLTVQNLRSVANGRPSPLEVDVRLVKRYLRRRWYHSPPDDAVFVSRYLLRAEPFDLPAGNFRQVFLILHVPPQTPPGRYRGALRIAPEDAPATEITLQVEVLPFTLRAPPHKKYALYYRGTVPGVPPEEQERIVRRELADIRAHGASRILWRPRITYTKTDETIEIGYDEVREKLRLLREFGFEGPYIVWTGFGWLSQLTDGEEGEQFLELARQALRGLLKVREEEGFPEIVVTHLDEVFGRGRLPRYIRLTKAVRQVPEFRMYITFHNQPRPGIAEMIQQIDPYVDIRCYHGHSIDMWLAAGHTFEELRAELEGSGDEAWTYYNPRSVDVTPEWMRIVNGVWLWMSPITTHCPWIYNAYRGDPLDDADGHDYGYAFPVGDEIVPTRLWEAYREGVDDVKYLYTLESLIAERRRVKPQAAQEAEEWLRRLRERLLNLPLEEEQSALVRAIAEKYSGDDYQQWRRECAGHILTLLAKK